MPMNPSQLRQQQLTRRKQARQEKASRGYLQGRVAGTGHTLLIDIGGSVIEAENLAGSVPLDGTVLVYQPLNSGRAYARPKSGLIP
jgi:hypothetical protein